MSQVGYLQAVSAFEQEQPATAQDQIVSAFGEAQSAMNRVVHLNKSGQTGSDGQRHGQPPPTPRRRQTVKRQQQPGAQQLNEFLPRC